MRTLARILAFTWLALFLTLTTLVGILAALAVQQHDQAGFFQALAMLVALVGAAYVAVVYLDLDATIDHAHNQEKGEL